MAAWPLMCSRINHQVQQPTPNLQTYALLATLNTQTSSHWRNEHKEHAHYRKLWPSWNGEAIDVKPNTVIRAPCLPPTDHPSLTFLPSHRPEDTDSIFQPGYLEALLLGRKGAMTVMKRFKKAPRDGKLEARDGLCHWSWRQTTSYCPFYLLGIGPSWWFPSSCCQIHFCWITAKNI